MGSYADRSKRFEAGVINFNIHLRQGLICWECSSRERRVPSASVWYEVLVS